MKHKILYISFIAALTVGTFVFAAEDHGHDHADEDMNSGFSMSEDEHKHGDEKHDEKGHGEEGHGEGGHDEHNEGGVELSKAQLAAAGIVVEPLRERLVARFIDAPGEVFFNAYRSKKITPRINAQIIKRHKRLGQIVKKGQTLVTLTSVEMAQAQGELIVADQEWMRVKKLGKKVVSERRFVETQIARQQAYAKVLAFGMTKSQVGQLVKGKDPGKAIGKFSLLATQAGTITHDSFIEGEIIAPGRVLFEITDESSMWVEARLTPKTIVGIKAGFNASVIVDNKTYSAQVTQIHHQLDEKTRTIAVRMEVENLNDALHPGLFVETRIQTKGDEMALALPETAVLRSPDGDWAVFVEEEAGHFKSQEVEIVSKSDNLVVIDGIAENTRVVTKGAFFVQSEIAKSGFSVHNH